MITDKCRTCRYAQWDYDDAYGATVWWVEGCKREDKGCIREEDDD